MDAFLFLLDDSKEDNKDGKTEWPDFPGEKPTKGQLITLNPTLLSCEKKNELKAFDFMLLTVGSSNPAASDASQAEWLDELEAAKSERWPMIL